MNVLIFPFHQEEIPVHSRPSLLALIATVTLAAALPLAAGQLLPTKDGKFSQTLNIPLLWSNPMGMEVSGAPQPVFVVNLRANGEIELLLEGVRIWASNYNAQFGGYKRFTMDQIDSGPDRGKIIIHGWKQSGGNPPPAEIKVDTWHSLINKPGLRFGLTPSFDFGLVCDDEEKGVVMVEGKQKWADLAPIIADRVDKVKGTHHREAIDSDMENRADQDGFASNRGKQEHRGHAAGDDVWKAYVPWTPN
jgi:hypothetical protein